MTSTTTRRTTTSTAEPSGLLVLGLGSNVGASEAVLRWAIGELSRCLGPFTVGLFTVAPLYRSAPLSPVPQPHYLNTVILGTATAAAAPEEILAVCKAVEHAAGRRRGVRFGPRELDVDLLLCGEHRSDRPELTLPHPRLRERRFVLAPLADLAHDLALPPDGARVGDLLAALGESQEIERIDWAV